MTKKSDHEPLLMCGRCRGSGFVTISAAGDYLVEDSAPRELPIRTCDECNGAGQVPEQEAGA